MKGDVRSTPKGDVRSTPTRVVEKPNKRRVVHSLCQGTTLRLVPYLARVTTVAGIEPLGSRRFVSDISEPLV